MNRRVAIIADNSIKYVEKILWAWKNGYSVVLLDSRIPHLKCVELLKDSNVEEVITDNIELYQFAKEQHMITALIDNSKKVCKLPQYVYSQYYCNESDKEAIVLFSSGTTGRNKGISLSHYSITTSAKKIMKIKNVNESSVLYIYKTFAHCASFIGELMVALISHAQMYISPISTIMRKNISNMIKYDVTHISINPTIISLLNLDHKYYKFKKLEMVTCSGAILSKKMYCLSKKYFNCKIINSYGLTETSAMVTVKVDSEKSINEIMSVGKPLENIKVTIHDIHGKEKEVGEKGYIRIYSDTIYDGYITKEREKKKYFDTNDVGYIGENGELYIIGRKDRMIISGAHNIFPETIENILIDSGLVRECIVYAQKDEIYGQKIICEYTLNKKEKKNSYEIKNSIYSICQKKLAKYEIPHKFVEKEKLEQTYSGKLKVKFIEGEINDKKHLAINKSGF